MMYNNFWNKRFWAWVFWPEYYWPWAALRILTAQNRAQAQFVCTLSIKSSLDTTIQCDSIIKGEPQASSAFTCQSIAAAIYLSELETEYIFSGTAIASSAFKAVVIAGPIFDGGVIVGPAFKGEHTIDPAFEASILSSSYIGRI